MSSLPIALLFLMVPFSTDSEDMTMKDLVVANNAFALDLHTSVRDEAENVFLSPFSVSTALAMTLAGAKSRTAAQMAGVLRLPGGKRGLHPAYKVLLGECNAAGRSEGCRLHVANRLWGQKGYAFMESFLRLVENEYGAGLEEVDFIRATEKARTRINGWVEEKTEEKIKDLIKPGVLDPATRLVLTNAIYFKGKWAITFDEKRTGEEAFHVAEGKTVKVPMMHMEKKRFPYGEGPDFQIIELPYSGETLSMVILLPRSPEGLDRFEKGLSPQKLDKMLQVLRSEEVNLFLPRFRIEFEVNLSDALKALGMPDAFIAGQADFSGMNGKRDLFLSAVVHKAFVEVNEEGTEAAAATGGVMTLAMVKKPIVFRADHPFLFFIRHRESGTILFFGRVTNPL